MIDSVKSLLEVKEDYRVHIAAIDVVCPIISSLKKSSDCRVEASEPWLAVRENIFVGQKCVGLFVDYPFENFRNSRNNGDRKVMCKSIPTTCIPPPGKPRTFDTRVSPGGQAFGS